MPKVVKMAQDAAETARRVEAIVIDSREEGDERRAIWEYLREKERIDSVRRKEAEILRLLEEIRSRQIGDFKFNDRVE
jgi:hypothetical protein